MYIKLKDGYVVTSDQYTYILGKEVDTVDKDGNPKKAVRGEKYVATLEGILKVFKEMLYRDNQATTIQEFLDHVKSVDKYIESVIGRV